MLEEFADILNQTVTIEPFTGHDEFGEKGFPTIDYGLCYPSKVVKLTKKYIIKN